MPNNARVESSKKENKKKTEYLLIYMEERPKLSQIGIKTTQE
jgi:hypothetical protein